MWKMIHSDLHKLPQCEKVQILFAGISGGLHPCYLSHDLYLSLKPAAC